MVLIPTENPGTVQSKTRDSHFVLIMANVGLSIQYFHDSYTFRSLHVHLDKTHTCQVTMRAGTMQGGKRLSPGSVVRTDSFVDPVSHRITSAATEVIRGK